jgi:hypothetical protein
MFRNIINPAAAATALFAFVALLFAFSAPQGAPDEQSAGGIYKPPVRTATITNTGADTLVVPVNLISLWAYNWTASATQTSGTSNIIVVVQESNETTGALWYEVGRDTLSAATGGLIKTGKGTVGGVRQRVIATGVGTHSSAYRLTGTYKRVN